MPLTTVKEKNGISVVTDGTLKYLSRADLAKLLKTTSAVLDPRVAAAPNSPITAIDTVDYVSETRLPGLLSYLTRLPTPIVVSNEALSSLRKLSQNSFKLESLLGLEATAPSQAATAPGTTTATIDLESVDDRVAGLIQAGSGITKVYDDLANTLTISATAVAGGGATQVTTIGQFLATANKAPGASAFLRLIADGVPANTPVFTGYKVLLSNWNNGNGIANLLEFFYDGVDHYLSVNAAIGAIAVDTTAPARVGLPVLNATRTQITIAYNEPITGTVAAANYALTGATITSLSIVGQSVVIIVPAIAANAVVTLAYTAQTIVDGAGNPAPTFAAITLDTTAIVPVFNNRNTFLAESNGVYTPGTAVAWDAIGASSTPIFAGAATFDIKLNGNVATSGFFMGVDVDSSLGNYTTFDYGLYKEYATSYQKLINGSFSAVTPAVAAPVTGDRLRLARDASNTLRGFFSRDDGATWTLIHNFGVITSAPLYVKANGFIGTWSNVSVS
jgi:hypothetical protein